MKNPQRAGSRVKHREEEDCKSLEKAPGCAGTEPFGTEVITGHLRAQLHAAAGWAAAAPGSAEVAPS